MRWQFLRQMHREFSWEFAGERILKIGIRSHKYQRDCFLLEHSTWCRYLHECVHYARVKTVATVGVTGNGSRLADDPT